LAHLTVQRGGELIVLSATSTFDLRGGDLVEIRLPGGGGWGDPRLRDREAVARDLAAGLISADFATRLYGFTVRDERTK
jgi:N-methylhydantoinase B